MQPNRVEAKQGRAAWGPTAISQLRECSEPLTDLLLNCLMSASPCQGFLSWCVGLLNLLFSFLYCVYKLGEIILISEPELGK